MCGIVGLWDKTADTAGLNILIRQMADAVRLRGPDDEGYWLDERFRIAFGHRRLAVVDLSENGHQPMSSHCGRYVIVFNGEIYNHQNIREELAESQNLIWRGSSDTETLLAGISVWGVKQTLTRCVGMFAVGVWDRVNNELFLARDRMGEKPLYYAYNGNRLAFGSDINAVVRARVFPREVDRDALSLYLRHGYVPAPYSIYRGIRKLLPGVVTRICLRDGKCFAEGTEAYWSIENVFREAASNPLSCSEREAKETLSRLIRQSVSQQMVADVPLGAFLSGGVDSSLITAFMCAESASSVKTFSIGFSEAGFNEAEYARAVASHLHTDHTEFLVSSREAMDVIPILPSVYSEPFADSSQIPTYLVAKLARQSVTVSLSGDAGDELFGGYNRYVVASNYWRKLNKVPVGIRSRLSHPLLSIKTSSWNKGFSALDAFLPGTLKFSDAGNKVHKAASVLGCNSLDEVYLGLISQWPDTDRIVIGGSSASLLKIADCGYVTDGIERMMVMDLLTYLPDDILTKVDRAAMGVSLETRVPLLDHRIVEFAARIPLSMKIKGGVGKWLLKDILYDYVPRELIERPKMGFGIPLGDWLRGPLREWAEGLLSEERLDRDGYFHSSLVRSRWNEHLSGRRNWQSGLWCILMFQAWLETACE